MLIDLIRGLLDTKSKQAFFDVEQRLLGYLKEEERGNTDTDLEERAFRDVDTTIYS
jgi:hypothetical protein